jgi:hypothetical protein
LIQVIDLASTTRAGKLIALELKAPGVIHRPPLGEVSLNALDLGDDVITHRSHLVLAHAGNVRGDRGELVVNG